VVYYLSPLAISFVFRDSNLSHLC